VNADAEKPVFSGCPNDQLNVVMDAGKCGATITWTDPTANDNCDGGITPVRSDATGLNSGDLFPEGTTVISWTATDAAGNVQTCSFTVTVNADAEKPVFSGCPSDQLNVVMDAGKCGATITWTDPTANDNCDGAITPVRSDVTGLNSGDLFPEGTTVISWTATDAAGNVQTCSFTVTVNADAEKPVFSGCPNDQLNVVMDAGKC
ncbi:HYR domain-containing protein, partial [Puteibacter caeruleilacunae]